MDMQENNNVFYSPFKENIFKYQIFWYIFAQIPNFVAYFCSNTKQAV